MNPFRAWDDFFHARTGIDGCRLGGWMRISFAVLYLFDRLVLGLQLKYLFSPTTGLVPYSVGQDHPYAQPYEWSAFALAPESDTFLWAFYGLGVLHGSCFSWALHPVFSVLVFLFSIFPSAITISLRGTEKT